MANFDTLHQKNFFLTFALRFHYNFASTQPEKHNSANHEFQETLFTTTETKLQVETKRMSADDGGYLRLK